MTCQTRKHTTRSHLHTAAASSKDLRCYAFSGPITSSLPTYSLLARCAPLKPINITRYILPTRLSRTFEAQTWPARTRTYVILFILIATVAFAPHILK